MNPFMCSASRYALPKAVGRSYIVLCAVGTSMLRIANRVDIASDCPLAMLISYAVGTDGTQRTRKDVVNR